MRGFLIAASAAAMVFVASADVEAGARFVRLSNGQIVRVQNNRFNGNRSFNRGFNRGFRSFNRFDRPQVIQVRQRRSIFDFFLPRRDVFIIR